MKTQPRPFTMGLLAFATLLFLGCSRQLYVVLRRQQEGMLPAQKPFTLRPISFDEMQVGSHNESDWLAGRSDAQRMRWQRDRQAFQEQFFASVLREAQGVNVQVGTTSAPDAFTVQASVRAVFPGFYAGPIGDGTQIWMEIDVIDSQGTLVDRLRLFAQIDAAVYRAALGTRVRACGAELGVRFAQYLRVRTGTSR